MMCDTLISPGADHAIRKRVSSYKRRTQNPNFRDILRQRCRERVKAKRGALFDRLRHLDSEESMRSALSEYIDSDLRELQSFSSFGKVISEETDDIMDIVEDKPLSCMAESEKEKWILDEYERLITNAQAELADQVTCPMCDHGLLQTNSVTGIITCTLCSLTLPLKFPLPQVERLITLAVDIHESSCSEQPMFTVCPDTHLPSLMLMCTTCSYFHQVV